MLSGYLAPFLIGKLPFGPQASKETSSHDSRVRLAACRGLWLDEDEIQPDPEFLGWVQYEQSGGLGSMVERQSFFVPGLLLVMTLLLAPASASPARAPEPFQDCEDCPEMVAIPAGAFSMGLKKADVEKLNASGVLEAVTKREVPSHVVHIDRFSISTTEITRGQFLQFVNDTKREPGPDCFSYSKGDSSSKPRAPDDQTWLETGFLQGDDHPVVCVGWRDAKDYVDWLSKKTGRKYRLPSEAEWEYSAKAGSNSATYWRDASTACGWANILDDSGMRASYGTLSKPFPCNDGFTYTAPVAHFPANAFGLHDMEGNVSEWTADCEYVDYADAPPNGVARLPDDCAVLSIRGGSWDSDQMFVRPTRRDGATMEFRTVYLGFRIARDD